MTKTLKQILILIIVFSFVKKIDGQSVLYNYANLSTTEISTEFLDRDMIYETVDNDSNWQGSWTQNAWYNFDFGDAIDIRFLEISLNNPPYSKNSIRNDIKIKVEMVDTSLVFKLDQFENKFFIGKTSRVILIRILGTFHHISEIKILSKAKPRKKERGLPKINIKANKRIEISERIRGFSKKKSNREKKYWKNRICFYDNNLKNKSKLHSNATYERDIYSRNEYSFCHTIQYDVQHLTDKKIRYVNDECGCDMHDLFFNRRMKASDVMIKRPFKFYDHIIFYDSDTTQNVLKKILEDGDAYAGHAIPHVCLMNLRELIPKVDSLFQDSNKFTQFRALNGLMYFKEYERARSKVDSLIEREITSLQTHRKSEYGFEITMFLIELSEFYEEESMSQLIKLYEKYKKLETKDDEELRELLYTDSNEWTRRDHINSIIKEIEEFLDKNETLVLKYRKGKK